MGTGKTYSTKYLLDSNNSSGVAGQVLSTTSTGIDWVDANTVPGTGLWLANGNDIYNSNSSNVGIGTTNPSTGKLVVEGDPYVITNSGKALGGIDLRTNAGVSTGDYGAAISFGANGSGRAAISSVQGSSDSDRQGLVFFTHGSGTGAADAAEAMRISHDGKVGIGTTDPDALLDVSDRVHIDTYSSQAAGSNSFISGYMQIRAGAKTGWGIDDQLGKIEFYGADTSGVGARSAAGIIAVCETGNGTSTTTFSSGLAFYTSPYNAAQEERIRITADGNVGIGTDSPGTYAKLEVSTSQQYRGIVLSNGTNNVGWISGLSASNDDGQLSLSSGGVQKIQINAASNSYLNGGNVGIGTTSPYAKLEAQGPNIVSASPVVIKKAKLLNLSLATSAYYGGFAELWMGRYADVSNHAKSILTFSLNDGLYGSNTNADTDVMTLRGDGNVGIGTTSPRVKLHVNGTNASVGTIGTPKNDWYTAAYNGIQVGDGTTLWGRAGDSHFSGNYYVKNNGGVAQDTYINTFSANDLWLDNSSGSLKYRNAGLGGAGNAISWNTRFVVLTNGNFGIGTTNPSSKLEVSSPNNSVLKLINTELNYNANQQSILFQGVWWNGAPGALTNTARIAGTHYANGYHSGGLNFYSYENGTELNAMTIKHDSNVGIGIDDPLSKLQVDDTSDGDKIRWSRSGTLIGSLGTYNGVPYIGYQGGAGGGIMFNGASIEPTALGNSRTNNANDIGSPNYKWRNGYFGNAVSAATYTAAAAEGLRINDSAAYISGYNTAGTQRTGYIQFLHASGTILIDSELGSRYTVMALPSASAVGIGTSLPDEKLTVNGITRAVDQIFFGAINTDNITYGPFIESYDDKGLKFDYNGNNGGEFQVWNHDQNGGGAHEALTINQDSDVIMAGPSSPGHVGIGLDNPSSILHVKDTLVTAGIMCKFEAGVSGTTYGAVNMDIDCIPYGYAQIFHRDGNTGGNASSFRNGSSSVGSIIINTSSTSYNTTSDYRLKENLTPITDGIERVKLLKPKRFNFIGDPEVVDGFIAHEAKEVVKEAVTGEKDGVLPNGELEYQGIDQSKLVPLLTAALQEAIQRIEILEEKINK